MNVRVWYLVTSLLFMFSAIVSLISGATSTAATNFCLSVVFLSLSTLYDSPKKASKPKKAKRVKTPKKAKAAPMPALEPKPQLQLISSDAWERLKGQALEDQDIATVLRFAERWGLAMQAEIAQGHTVAEAASNTELTANHETLTGPMYARALMLLVETWQYGYELNVWAVQHEKA